MLADAPDSRYHDKVRRLSCCLLLAFLACTADDGPPDVRDAGVATRDGGVEEEPTFACTCEDNETCGDCMAKIGECCYGDPGLFALDAPLPMALPFALRCEADPSCKACCNECAALSCDELIAGNACPPIAPEQMDRNGNRFTSVASVPATTAALGANPDVLDDVLFNLGFYAFAVECALPEGASIDIMVDGQTLTLEGSAGVAPEWADGPCDEACQRWVTSCMAARINNWNVRARIFFRSSDHDEAGTGRDGDEEGGVPERHVEEGAFYGNFFADPPRIYACRGSGRDPLYDVVRVCSHLDGHCGIIPVGPCLPGPGEDDSVPHACERRDEHGSLRGCRNRLSRADGTFPPGATRYDELITIYIPETMFSAGLEAGGTCEQTPPPGDHPIREVPTSSATIGAACINDDDCNADDLICRVWQGPGHCTKGCTNGTPAEEEAQCGAGNTCLIHDDGNEYCVKSCVPFSVGGEGCGGGRVCTNFSLFSDPETPGCRNFCTLDTDCLPSQRCNREGICEIEGWGGPIEDRVPDGMPCTFDPPTPCRGICVAFTEDGGICGSLIDLAKRRRCIDDPLIMPPISVAQNDDLAICVFRTCQTNADCEAPLTCVGQGNQARCTYDI